jgi:hypothetical protein
MPIILLIDFMNIDALRAYRAEITAAESVQLACSTQPDIIVNVRAHQWDEDLREKYPRPSLVILSDLYSEPQATDEVAPSYQRAVREITDLSLKDAAHVDAAFKLSNDDANNCLEAEGFLRDAMQQVRRRRPMGQSRVAVYHSEDGVPILLRKRKKESTALSLVNLSVGGMYVPAGTIMALKEYTLALLPDGQRRAHDTSYATYKIDHTFGIRPLRISAWAYPEAIDRALFGFHDASWLDTKRAQMAMRYTIDDFREAAAKIMAMCQVN